MFRCSIAAVLLLVCCAVANSQIIYEPLQYQYPGDPSYYYGGDDPSVFEHAERMQCLCRHRSHDRDAVFHDCGKRLPIVYSDCLPYVNAAIYGYTANDARNDASRSVPRYFRKSELLAAAIVLRDGSVIVPAQARPIATIQIKPYRRPTAEPKPIIIIPRPRPVPQQTPPDQVVQAQVD